MTLIIKKELEPDRLLVIGQGRAQIMAEDPKTDPNKYYYRPGTTEPELRPEIAEAEAKAAEEEAAEEAAAAAKPAKKVAKKK